MVDPDHGVRPHHSRRQPQPLDDLAAIASAVMRGLLNAVPAETPAPVEDIPRITGRPPDQTRPAAVSDADAHSFSLIMRQRGIIVIDAQTWNARYRERYAAVEAGSLAEIAQLLRELYRVKPVHTQSFGERRFIAIVRRTIVHQVALARGASTQDVDNELDDLVRAGSDAPPPAELLPGAQYREAREFATAALARLRDGFTEAEHALITRLDAALLARDETAWRSAFAAARVVLQRCMAKLERLSRATVWLCDRVPNALASADRVFIERAAHGRERAPVDLEHNNATRRYYLESYRVRLAMLQLDLPLVEAGRPIPWTGRRLSWCLGLLNPDRILGFEQPILLPKENLQYAVPQLSDAFDSLDAYEALLQSSVSDIFFFLELPRLLDIELTVQERLHHSDSVGASPGTPSSLSPASRPIVGTVADQHALVSSGRPAHEEESGASRSISIRQPVQPGDPEVKMKRKPDPRIAAALHAHYPHQGYEDFIAENLAGAEEWRLEEARAAFYIDYRRPEQSPATLSDLTAMQRMAGAFRRKLLEST